MRIQVDVISKRSSHALLLVNIHFVYILDPGLTRHGD